jgi:hypothetical protein
VQDDDIITLGDSRLREQDAHPSTQGLCVKESLRNRSWFASAPAKKTSAGP